MNLHYLLKICKYIKYMILQYFRPGNSIDNKDTLMYNSLLETPCLSLIIFREEHHG